MTSPPGAEDDLLGTLSSRERSMLAAWADDGDVPDDFADRVVAAVLAERLGDGDGAEDGAEAAVARTRAAASEGKVVRLVGWVAAIAAAAAVMLMVRVLPRASEVGVAEARRPDGAEIGAAPVQSPAPVEPMDDPTCEPVDGAARLPRIDSPPVETPSAKLPEQAFAVLGADATLVLAQHCSPCHDSLDSEANPGALDVFDLEEPQWWLTMSDAQLEEARTRVQELGDASDDERRTLDAFVEARLRRPSHAG